ncbi:MAG: peptidyl-dipeptidase Dcp, partial [Glaciecola sp.]
MRFTISSRKLILGVSSAALLGISATPAMADNHGKKVTAAELTEASVMQAENDATTSNSVLQTWTGPYDGVPAWDKVEVSDFPGAFQAVMDEVELEVNAIRDNPAPATFENFTIPMELAG